MLSSLLFRKKRDTTNPTPMPSPSILSEPLGLKTLADAALATPIAPNRNLVVSRSASLSPSSNTKAINAEEEAKEEDDETNAEEEESDENACWATYGKRGHSRRFPPPIPLLARTGNLSCHMPWILKRTYKDDGSLVIQEVRTKHHEYFRARRENGRLILQLVELDDHSPPEEIKVGRTREMDVPMLALSSTTMMLSSSMPEPVCGKGCFGNGRSNPLQQMPLSRLRVVHS